MEKGMFGDKIKFRPKLVLDIWAALAALQAAAVSAWEVEGTGQVLVAGRLWGFALTRSRCSVVLIGKGKAVSAAHGAAFLVLPVSGGIELGGGG